MKNHAVVSALRARPMAAVAALFAVMIVGNAVLVGCGKKTDTTTTDQPPAGTDTSAQIPPAGGTPGGGEMGAAVYSQRCVLCHGASGKGDGPAAASLNPKPRNHTDGTYMNAQSDESLLGVIRDGKGAMPAWKSVLSEDEIQAVLKHVRSLAVPPYPS